MERIALQQVGGEPEQRQLHTPEPGVEPPRRKDPGQVAELAERIPGALFVSLESGGHLMLGQQKRGRDEVAAFFAGKRDRRDERAAS